MSCRANTNALRIQPITSALASGLRGKAFEGSFLEERVSKNFPQGTGPSSRREYPPFYSAQRQTKAASSLDSGVLTMARLAKDASVA